MYHNVIHNTGQPEENDNMNAANYDNAEKLLVSIEKMIAAETDKTKIAKLSKAREHMQWACAYIAHDRNDDAGRKLVAVRKILMEVVA